ncbi:hypothetical protein ACFYO1_01715 [Nocardia sp. NPDC006044]
MKQVVPIMEHLVHAQTGMSQDEVDPVTDAMSPTLDVPRTAAAYLY